jgi:membrane-bound lytic murein transglycosylase B
LVSSRVTRRRLGASLAQRVNEALAIRIIHDDQFAPVTTIHDVRQQAQLSICELCRESGFGRYTYQYQELTTLHTDPFNAPPYINCLRTWLANLFRRLGVQSSLDISLISGRFFESGCAYKKHATCNQ